MTDWHDDQFLCNSMILWYWWVLTIVVLLVSDTRNTNQCALEWHTRLRWYHDKVSASWALNLLVSPSEVWTFDWASTLLSHFSVCYPPVGFCGTLPLSWQPSQSPPTGGRPQRIQSTRPAGQAGAAAAGTESPGQGWSIDIGTKASVFQFLSSFFSSLPLH